MNWWYGSQRAPWYLRLISRLHARYRKYRTIPAKQHDYPVCIVVVGNITIGGAGKTPTVIAIGQLLQAQGYRVGVISRGYGRVSEDLYSVDEQSQVADVGDEPLLIFQQLQCPVVVATDRQQALEKLLEGGQLDVVLSDDGLQHSALPRDLEICLIDGRRGLGNGLLIPAGPLREPPEAMARVDRILYKECQPQGLPLGDVMTVDLPFAHSLDGTQRCDLEEWEGKVVQAVAGIANPESFFKSLETRGIRVKRHSLLDHQACDYHQARRWSRQGPVLMTTKDAIKWPPDIQNNVWVVPMILDLPLAFQRWLLRAVSRRLSEQSLHTIDETNELRTSHVD